MMQFLSDATKFQVQYWAEFYNLQRFVLMVRNVRKGESALTPTLALTLLMPAGVRRQFGKSSSENLKTAGIEVRGI